MKRFRKTEFAVLAAGALFAVCGCGRKHPAPPTERGELVLRFFRSMEQGDAAAASEQGGKLRAMDSGNDYLEKLISIQQSNAYLKRAQEALNGGDADGALKALDEGIRVYPMNAALKQARRDVRALRNVPVLIAGLRQARSENSGEMMAALNAAETGLPAKLPERYRQYLARYRAEAEEKAADEKRPPAEPTLPETAPAAPDSGN